MVRLLLKDRGAALSCSKHLECVVELRLVSLEPVFGEVMHTLDWRFEFEFILRIHKVSVTWLCKQASVNSSESSDKGEKKLRYTQWTTGEWLRNGAASDPRVVELVQRNRRLRHPDADRPRESDGQKAGQLRRVRAPDWK